MPQGVCVVAKRTKPHSVLLVLLVSDYVHRLLGAHAGVPSATWRGRCRRKLDPARRGVLHRRRIRCIAPGRGVQRDEEDDM